MLILLLSIIPLLQFHAVQGAHQTTYRNQRSCQKNGVTYAHYARIIDADFWYRCNNGAINGPHGCYSYGEVYEFEDEFGEDVFWIKCKREARTVVKEHIGCFNHGRYLYFDRTYDEDGYRYKCTLSGLALIGCMGVGSPGVPMFYAKSTENGDRMVTRVFKYTVPHLTINIRGTCRDTGTGIQLKRHVDCVVVTDGGVIIKVITFGCTAMFTHNGVKFDLTCKSDDELKLTSYRGQQDGRCT